MKWKDLNNMAFMLMFMAIAFTAMKVIDLGKQMRLANKRLKSIHCEMKNLDCREW